MDACLDIVIVNWNSGRHLASCLESIASASGESACLQKVIVIDNNSTDMSKPEPGSFGLPLKVHANSRNLGFSAACNQGAAMGEADYLLFLNPDTVLFEDSLTVPLSFMEEPGNERVGITGIQLIDDAGGISRTCARFPTFRRYVSHSIGLDRIFPRRFPGQFMSDWDHSQNREVDHVMGAFFLVRRSLFETLGGFDERFFVYAEDMDFSLRARDAGWKSYYLSETRAYHRGGGSSEQVRALRLFYSLRSKLLFAFKHFSGVEAVLLSLTVLLLEPIFRIFNAVSHRSAAEVSEVFRSYAMLLRDLPSMKSSRSAE